MPESRQTIRKDLMRRWFAVAISVGFATTLVHMQWLNAGQFPNGDEWQQLARLTTALCAVVLSWEGYFFSIESKPLNTTPRFVIDFVLVLLYMVLLYTSKIPTFWLYIHAISFLLYFSWDLLSISEYRRTYSCAPAAQELATSEIYIGGFLGRDGVYRGPIITLSWTIFFVLLAASQIIFGHRNSFILAPFAIAGLLLYRNDKSRASKAMTGTVPAYGMVWRTLVVLGLLMGVALVSELLPDQTIASLVNCLSS
jgi:hypothetical protein